MAKDKLKLVTANGEEIHTPMPTVKGVLPCGAQVLLEVLTPQELMNTTLSVGTNADPKVPLQAYVRAAGPAFKSADWGFKVGDRVLLSGTGVMAPNWNENHRDSFLMEPHAVKAVLPE
jgi:hypothetical protein